MSSYYLNASSLSAPRRPYSGIFSAAMDRVGVAATRVIWVTHTAAAIQDCAVAEAGIHRILVHASAPPSPFLVPVIHAPTPVAFAALFGVDTSRGVPTALAGKTSVIDDDEASRHTLTIPAAAWLPTHNLQVGDVCAGVYTIDQLYYPAVVQSLDATHVTVVYEGFGNVETLPRTQVISR
jgi:hypothetical protein